MKIVFNEKNEKDSTKHIFKLLKKVQFLEKFDCKYTMEFIALTENDLKNFFCCFVLRIYFLKLQGNITTLEKIIKLYNDSPEVDTAAIVICKNLLAIEF